ncbi:hypothetical protein [Streptomyces sp. NPDC002990]
MPRGRHRNPEPLHRLLTPTTVAGVSLTSAVAAWLLAGPDDGTALRLLVSLAAASGVTGAVVMRAWDRSAGRRVAELARERIRDEWKTDERIAELESELEEARALRAKLDTKLRAKRVELAGLRGEHAALLRRYATAETERASALEGRRLLAIEASATPAPAPKELPAVSPERTSAGAPTPVGYARAHAALRELARKAALPATPAALTAADGRGRPAIGGAPAAAVPARRPPAAVAPYASQRRTASRVEGGFDFFGTQNAARARAAIEAVQNEDLADVVGEEALAAHKAEESGRPPAEPARGAEATEPAAPESPEGEEAPQSPEAREPGGQVIDLTAHDETEPAEVVRLRTAIS